MIANRSPARRPAYVLIAVLLVVVVLSFASYRYVDAMTAEYSSATRQTQAMQAKAFAISGVHFAMAAMSDPNYFQQTIAGVYQDNPNAFQNAVAGTGDGPRGGGRFSLMNVSPDGNGGFNLSYGIADEAGKINVNAFMLLDPTGQVLYDALMKLTAYGMTEDLADAIVDWLDADDTPRAAGAESGDYPNYRPKNGPINTLGELLLVRGMTVQLLYGTDLNRNGVLDPDEAAGGGLSRGLSEFLTAYGHEANVDTTGTGRIDLTADTLSDVYEQLLASVPGEMADYILAYRMFTTTATGTTSQSSSTGGNSSGGGSSSGGGNSSGGTTATQTATPEQVQSAVQLALTTGLGTSRRKPKSVTEFLNTQITLPQTLGVPPNTPRFSYPSPLNNPDKLKLYLPSLLDKTSTTPGTELIPRVNINVASREVLMAIPGMTDEYADNIIATRGSLDPLDPATMTAAWLVTQMSMPTTTFNQMSRFITGTSQIYRVQSLGYFQNGGPTARVEAVFDTNLGKPRIVFFRDLTELGKGFDPPR
jgi:hypothetical protein